MYYNEIIFQGDIMLIDSIKFRISDCREREKQENQDYHYLEKKR